MGWFKFRHSDTRTERRSSRGPLFRANSLLRGECLEPRLPLDASGDAFAQAAATAADPRLFIAQDIVVKVNNTVAVPVQILVTEAGGIKLSGADVVLTYDATKFSASNARVGGALAGFGLTANTTVPGTIRFSASNATSVSLPFNFTGSLFIADFTALAGPGSFAPINLLASDSAMVTALFDDDANELLLVPAPTNASNDAVDGKITISTIALNPNIAEDVDDDGHVSAVDLVWEVDALNSPPSASPGPPGKRLFLDVNGDGSVSGFDLIAVAAKINSGTAPFQLKAAAVSADDSANAFNEVAFGLSALASAVAPAPAFAPASSALAPASVDEAIAQFEAQPVHAAESESASRSTLSEGHEDADDPIASADLDSLKALL